MRSSRPKQVRALRRARIVAGLSIVLAALLLAAFLVRTPGDASLYPPRAGEAARIFLVDNGFHSDLALPRAEVERLSPAVAATAGRLGTGDWLVVGWGDARFYTQSGFSSARLLDGLRALFWPGNPSVIRVQVLRPAPPRAFEASAVTPIDLSRRGFARLVAGLDQSLRRDGAGAPIAAAGVREDPGAHYFESVEHFSIMHVCNHWTGALLSRAGLPMHPVLDALPWGLKRDVRAKR
jgi:uncharacterized protein (TIGR02117 family)